MMMMMMVMMMEMMMEMMMTMMTVMTMMMKVQQNYLNRKSQLLQEMRMLDSWTITYIVVVVKITELLFFN